MPLKPNEALMEAVAALIDVGDPTHADASPFPFQCVYCHGRERGGLFNQHIDHAETCPWALLRDMVDAARRDNDA